MTDDGDVYRIDVEITTPLNPTEYRDRVGEAITALFPAADVEERHGELVGEAHSLDRFRERLFEQEIVDTARDLFFDNREGDGFHFDLKKQAAYEGTVNFAVGNPDELGDVHVRVRVDEPSVEEFLDDFVPRTEDERPDE